MAGDLRTHAQQTAFGNGSRKRCDETSNQFYRSPCDRSNRRCGAVGVTGRSGSLLRISVSRHALPRSSAATIRTSAIPELTTAISAPLPAFALLHARSGPRPVGAEPAPDTDRLLTSRGSRARSTVSLVIQLEPDGIAFLQHFPFPCTRVRRLSEARANWDCRRVRIVLCDPIRPAPWRRSVDANGTALLFRRRMDKS